MERNHAEQRKWFIGVDLGQSQDHTAIVVLDRVTVPVSGPDAVVPPSACETTYNVRHLERMKLGTPYQAVVERIRTLVENPVFGGKVTLVVDATGVGGPVVDLLSEALRGKPIVPVVITGGDRTYFEQGRYRVPKRDLISGVTVLLESGRLRISQRLPEAKTLMDELLNMRVKISDAGNDAYGAWRSGEHDDMVLALALAVWRARLSSRRQMGVRRPLLTY
jgi:hypothetical protein